MDFNITYLFSITAIIVSITTIYITRRNLKKQLRLGKLEEILEILNYLNGYYNSVFKVFIGIEQSLEALKNSGDVTDELKDSIKYREELINNISREIIVSKISRLKVLSNAYLKNSSQVNGLKVRIHTISDLYYNMYIYCYTNGNPSIMKKNDDVIIPKPNEMRNYIKKIENDIIVEMNLGYKSIAEDAIDKYFLTQFKKDIQS